MTFKILGIALSALLCSGGAAAAVDLGVEKIAAQITARSASRNIHADTVGGDLLAIVHQRMQSAINCLVGPKAEGFSAAAPNPCAASGNGLIPDTEDAGKKEQYQSVVEKLKTGLATDDRGAAMQIALEAADMIVAISED